MSGSGPIYEYQREVTERLEQAIRERDEARAEADKLREVLLSKHGGEPLALLQELDEARAEVGRAFKRGAEAMREAAALCAEREETQLPLHVASAIRAMPVPEDKP